MFARILLLALGVVACSTAAILIKASHVHPLVLTALRLPVATLLLAPLFLRDIHRTPHAFTRAHARRALLPAVVFAAHLITWAYAARMVLAAQANLIIGLAPVALPFFLHALVGEHINRREIIGTTVALLGVFVLSARDALAPGGSLWGNIICFISMILFAWYLALGRRNRDFASIWVYIVPVYFFAGLICLAIAAPLLPHFDATSPREWLLIIALVVIPTLMGHTILNQSMRHLRGQVVSLANMGQFIFSGVIAFFVFGEVPPLLFYIASALAVGGVSAVVLSAPPQPRLR